MGRHSARVSDPEPSGRSSPDDPVFNRSAAALAVAPIRSITSPRGGSSKSFWASRVGGPARGGVDEDALGAFSYLSPGLRRGPGSPGGVRRV